MNPLVANDPINERADREGWAGGGKKIIGRPTLSKLEIPSIIVLYTITMELRFVPMENSCNSAENKWTASFSARSSPSLSPTHPLSLCFSFVLHETRFRVNESTFLINELHDNLSVHHSMESSSEEFPSTSILLSFFPIFFFFDYRRFEMEFVKSENDSINETGCRKLSIIPFFNSFVSIFYTSYTLCYMV